MRFSIGKVISKRQAARYEAKSMVTRLLEYESLLFHLLAGWPDSLANLFVTVVYIPHTLFLIP